MGLRGGGGRMVKEGTVLGVCVLCLASLLHSECIFPCCCCLSYLIVVTAALSPSFLYTLSSLSLYHHFYSLVLCFFSLAKV